MPLDHLVINHTLCNLDFEHVKENFEHFFKCDKYESKLISLPMVETQQKLSAYFVILFICHDFIDKYCDPSITQLGVMMTDVAL